MSEPHCTSCVHVGAVDEASIVARFTIAGEPVSKERARVSGKGAYTPEKTRAAEEVVGWEFRQVARGHALDPDASYGVVVRLFCGTRRRRDVDNMLKLVLDGLNKVAWPDDSQVVEASARKEHVPAGEARTEVTVYRAEVATDG